MGLLTKARLLREEGGFTVVEMMITITIWIMVLLVLANIFDTGVRIFTVGNNKIEATESARLGLERMEREIRAAYPVDASDPAKRFLFFNATGVSPPAGAATPGNPGLSASQITFGNELVAESDENQRTILCPNAANCEYITYKLTDDTTNTTCIAFPCTLRRINTANSSAALTTGPNPGPGQYAVVEDVALNGLTFRYFAADGTEIDPANPGAFTEADIVKVLVSLQITVDQDNPNYDATQRLTTEIDLRNRE